MKSTRHIRAVSLPEILTVIALIGVLGSIAVPNVGHVLPGSARIVAADSEASANRAVRLYDQANQTIAQPADAGSADDEVAVRALLVTRDPALKGSPYLSEQFSSTTSSDEQTYRLAWTGRSFLVLEPGTEGHGILLDITP